MALLDGRIDTDKLFAYLIRKMGRYLSPVLLHGLTAKEFRKLVLQPCATFCAKHGVQVRHRAACGKSRSLAELWAIMQRHYLQHGAGSIVLGIGGRYEHWTCVRAITDKTILLADSSVLRRLYRRHITIDKTVTAPHWLHPRETFLMTVVRK